MYARFAWHLKRFLRTPFTLEQSQAIIRERLGRREQNLLTLVKTTIYENPDSPYLKLLESTGCQYGDFEKAVLADGVEPTLERLRQEGVFLSAEEFKGRQEVIRSGCAFRVSDADLDNPLTTSHLTGKSGGSRSAGTRTDYDLDYLALGRAVYTLCWLNALKTLDGPHILWAPLAPGFGPLEILACAKMGKTPEKWFTPVRGKTFRPTLLSRVATQYIVIAGNLFGAGLPGPEVVPLEEAGRIAVFVATALEKHGSCSIETYTSNAVRICRAAGEQGLSLAGAVFLPTGEPLTEAKLQEIEASGARAYTRYVFTEGGYVGFGCLHPSAADDVHLLEDALAVIQHRREVRHAVVNVEAFLFTSILPQAPKVLLNVENGDYGVLESRRCGCALEALGFGRHMTRIRGFDKLTGEGMTFVGTDVVRIVEEVLPARYGGGTTDYQVVEEEDERGLTGVSVLVSPKVGAVDEPALVRTVLTELARGSAGNRLMARVWSEAGTLQVRREHPRLTARGKLLPLHIYPATKKRPPTDN